MNIHTNKPCSCPQEHERTVKNLQKHSRYWEKLALPKWRPPFYTWGIATPRGQRYSLQSVGSERRQKVLSFYYLACCVIYRLFPGLPPPWMCSNGRECFGREHTDCCLAHTIQWELFLLSAKTTAWKYVLLRHFAVWKCSRNWFHGCKSRIIMSS